MKILHIMPYTPVPPISGGPLRMYHIMRMLAEHHDVTVVVYSMHDDLPKLRAEFSRKLRAIHVVMYGWKRRFKRIIQVLSFWSKHSFFYTIAYSDRMQKVIDRVIAENDFDIVLTEFSSMGSYTLRTNAVKILDSHNVEYDIFRRQWLKANSPFRKLHYYDEYKKFYHEELAHYQKQDALFTTSSRDKDILDHEIPEIAKYVVPNGVDASYFAPSGQTPEPHSLVFTGALSYLPNSDGVLYFLDNIFPLIQKQVPDAKIYVVGMNPSKEIIRRANTNVIVTNFVDDVRPYVYRSSVFVVPLRMGGGTRLKVLEAMAMQKPIVSTSIGCEGINVEHGRSILIADTPQAFADETVRLLNDGALRSQLAAEGFALMNAQYEWTVIGRQIEQLIRRIHSEKKR